MEYVIYIFFVIIIICIVCRKKPTSNADLEEPKFLDEPKKEDFKVPYEFKKRNYFMTSPENGFYKKLVLLYGDKYFIFPQVSIANILSEKINGQNWKAARNVINRKSVDYLICDKNYITPLVAIELDDFSHDREDRIKRDALVEQMFINSGMPLVRFKNVNNLSDYELKEKIESALNNSDKN